MMVRPERANKKTRRDAALELLSSLADDEEAVSRLIRAEAEHIRAFTGADGSFPTHPTNKQIIEFQSGVVRMVEALTEKQKLVIRTLELIKELEAEGEVDREWSEE